MKTKSSHLLASIPMHVHTGVVALLVATQPYFALVVVLLTLTTQSYTNVSLLGGAAMSVLFALMSVTIIMYSFVVRAEEGGAISAHLEATYERTPHGQCVQRHYPSANGRA